VSLLYRAGLMVGSELSIAAFVHPTLDRLPTLSICPRQAPWLACWADSCRFVHLVFLLTLAEVLILWHQSGRYRSGLLRRPFCGRWPVCIRHHFSPINNRIVSWARSPRLPMEDISSRWTCFTLACSAPHDSFRISNRWSRYK